MKGADPESSCSLGDLRIDSVLTVTDPQLGRIVRFSLEGEHLETTRQERRPVTPDGMEVPLAAVTSLPDSYLIGATVGWYSYGGVRDGEAALGDPFSHIVLFHPDGARVDTLASYHMNAGRWDALGLLGGGVDPGLGASGAWPGWRWNNAGSQGCCGATSWGRELWARALSAGERQRVACARVLATVNAVCTVQQASGVACSGWLGTPHLKEEVMKKVRSRWSR